MSSKTQVWPVPIFDEHNVKYELFHQNFLDYQAISIEQTTFLKIVDGV